MVLWQPEVVEALVVECGGGRVGDWEAEKVETHGEREKEVSGEYLPEFSGSRFFLFIPLLRF